MSDHDRRVGNRFSPVFNVASACANLGQPACWFYNQEWDGRGPDYAGNMPRERFPEQIVGQVAIRDSLAALTAAAIGREKPYSNRHATNLMRDARVLEHCNWLVQSIPAIHKTSLQAIAGRLVTAKARRNRAAAGTDCSSGSSITK